MPRSRYVYRRDLFRTDRIGLSIGQRSSADPFWRGRTKSITRAVAIPGVVSTVRHEKKWTSDHGSCAVAAVRCVECIRSVQVAVPAEALSARSDHRSEGGGRMITASSVRPSRNSHRARARFYKTIVAPANAATSRHISTRWPSFLNNTYLPVAVLPALIAFPKNCKREHRTDWPFGGRKICEPKIQFLLVYRLRLVSPLPIIR